MCGSLDERKKSLNGVVQAAPNQLVDCVFVFSQLVVPKSDDTISLFFQPTRALRIVFSLQRVLTAVQFQNQPLIKANEIHNVLSKRYLATEFELAETAVAQFRPKQSLSVGQFSAKRTSAFE